MTIRVILPGNRGSINVFPGKDSDVAVATFEEDELDIIGLPEGEGGYVCDSKGREADKTDAELGKKTKYIHPVSRKEYILEGGD